MRLAASTESPPQQPQRVGRCDHVTQPLAKHVPPCAPLPAQVHSRRGLQPRRAGPSPHRSLPGLRGRRRFQDNIRHGLLAHAAPRFLRRRRRQDRGPAAGGRRRFLHRRALRYRRQWQQGDPTRVVVCHCAPAKHDDHNGHDHDDDHDHYNDYDNDNDDYNDDNDIYNDDDDDDHHHHHHDDYDYDHHPTGVSARDFAQPRHPRWMCGPHQRRPCRWPGLHAVRADARLRGHGHNGRHGAGHHVCTRAGRARGRVFRRDGHGDGAGQGHSRGHGQVCARGRRQRWGACHCHRLRL